MKTSVKRIACSVFAFCLLTYALSACGSKKSSGTEDQASKSQDPIVTSEIVPFEADYTGWENFDPYATMSESLKGSTVRFATWIDHETTSCAKPLHEMEAAIGIKPEIMHVSQGGYPNLIKTQIAAGNIPDVFVSNEGDQSFPLTLEIACPIDVYSTVNLEEPFWDKDMMTYFTLDGHVYMTNSYGTPHSGGNMVFYNKTLFGDNGFKTPQDYVDEGNWSWQTLEKCMKDVISLGDGYYGGSITDPDIIAASAGASFCVYDYKSGKFTNGCNSDKLVTAYETYANWGAAGLIGGTIEKFCQGKCGIVVRGPYGLSTTGYFKDMDWNDVGFVRLPALSDGTQPILSAIPKAYGIVEGAKNADGAGYFLRYWLDAKNYDLNDSFISTEAGQFFFNLTYTPITERYYNFDSSCAVLIGQKSMSVFNRGATTATAANVKAKIEEVNNLVNDACAEANKLLDAKVAKYKDK